MKFLVFCLQLTSLELQYVSPKLLHCTDLELAVPGTYDPKKPIVKIRKVQSSLAVITSKQRPRKLSVFGKKRVFMFVIIIPPPPNRWNYGGSLLESADAQFIFVIFIPPTNESKGGGYIGVSRRSVSQLVCWWNVVSQTPPTVSKSGQRVPELCPLFPVTKTWYTHHNRWKV